MAISTLCRVLFLAISLSLCDTRASYPQNSDLSQLSESRQKQEASLESKDCQRLLGLLRDLRIDLRRLRRSAAALFDEVTRPPISPQTPLDIVGPMEISRPLRVSEREYLEPREALLNESFQQVSFIVNILDGDFDLIKRQLIANTKKLKEQQLVNMHLNKLLESRVVFKEELDKLRKLIDGPEFENGAIARSSKIIYKSCKETELSRKFLYKILRRKLKSQTVR